MKEKIAIQSRNGMDIINIRDIVRCEAYGKGTKLFFTTGKQVVSERELAHYSERLHGNLFYRTHHKHLVNTHHIIKYYRGSIGIIEMSDGSAVPVARNEKTNFVYFFHGKKGPDE